MNKEFCPKCSTIISNDFGHTLSFCTNCGAALNNLTSDETIELKKETVGNKKPKNGLFIGLILGAVLTLSLLGGGFLFFSSYFSQNETNSAGKQNPASSPWIKLPSFSSVDASEITELTFYSWQHNGSLTSGDGYVESNRITFERAGKATQTISVNYDDGERTDNSATYKAVISDEQFQRLAQKLVENDFFDQTDSTERISERENVLTVKHSGKEKKIKTSNIERDTPEIKAILNEIIYIQSELSWKAENQTSVEKK
ncbi:MAG: hypothetical protein ACR2F2_08595 [Pyrinomonadaceae bacterium]